MKSYEGVALLSPVSFGYSRQSPRSAAWFIGRTFQTVIQNAGLRKEDIDGFAVTSFSLGSDSVVTLTQQFGITPRWIEQFPYGGASGVIALRRAARAIQCGDAEIIACIGGDAAAHRSFENQASIFSGFTIDSSFPYGAGGPNTAFSLITRNYMEKYGVSREDFARISLDQRYNANHYEPALLGHKTLSLDEYMNARRIAGPLHLFDCVMPCAGGEGFLVMNEDRARHLKQPYCIIRSAQELHNAHPSDEIQFRGGWTEFVSGLYDTAQIGPDEIDLVQTYDDYPVISMLQLEDLGFCQKGDAKTFVQETDMRFDGSGTQRKKLPHNTNGGQLSVGQAGAAAGYLGLNETLRQLTGRAVNNSVREANVGLISGFGMINYDRGLCSGAAILARPQA